MGLIGMIIMGFGGLLTIYSLVSGIRKSKKQTHRRLPSLFVIFLLVTPFVFGTLIALEGHLLLYSIPRIIFMWGMTVVFWHVMLFVPMAVYSKINYDKQPNLTYYPTLTVLVPAYNEEKVIARTIASLIDSDYPNKEIIIIDDGSKDRTLDIVKIYRKDIIVLHKENGGKASALNYGLVYAKGEIIVIVDADTMIGKTALKEIVKGFRNDTRIAAVAGNIKVRNRINLLTNCQALEYIAGIQIVRRAFDLFGTITIVPGALGAFRKKFLEDLGTYDKDTIVEDFDMTIKLLKVKLSRQGSTDAIAYTQAPDTLADFIKQRRRWYRGNIQVLKKHFDIMTNSHFGFLQKLAFPYMVLVMMVIPVIEFTSIANAIFAIVTGDGIFVLKMFLVFMIVNGMMTALSLRIDGESLKLVKYSVFLMLGFKQIVDCLLLKALIDEILGRNAVWTSANRTRD